MKPISRRGMLGKTGVVATTAAASLPLAAIAAQSSSATAAPGTKKAKAVVTGGHPGDPEYGCGGTIARYTDLGHEVVLLYLNRGDWSDRPGHDPGPVRAAEAARACEILRARPVFAGQHDGRSIVDQAHYEEFHRLLEREQPQVVFTHWPIDNHADHRVIAMLVHEAWLRMKRTFALYFYEVSNGEDTVQFTPTHYVDISDSVSRKRSACYAHSSQSPDKYFALQELVTRMRGAESGHQQAEAYIRHVQSPDFSLPIVS